MHGSRRQEAKGVVHQAEGNVRRGIGDVQQAVEGPAQRDATKADTTKADTTKADKIKS